MAKVNPCLEKYEMKTTQVQDALYVFHLPNHTIPCSVAICSEFKYSLLEKQGGAQVLGSHTNLYNVRKFRKFQDY